MNTNILILTLSAAVLALGVPVGYLIAYLARDEIVQGRKWFKSLVLVFLVVAIVFIVMKGYAIALTSLFIVIVSLISYIKSHDKTWVRTRE